MLGAKRHVIQIEKVSLHIGDSILLDRISLDAPETRIAVIGRNGSGKSSLVRILGGLIKPTEGSALIDKCDVYADRKGALRTIGIIFQNPDHQIIFPTVGEEIRFGLTQLGQSKAEAHKAVLSILQTFGKSDWLDRSVSTLSQGQRHLVCLLSVLVMKPKVILLDEAFAGLDIPTKQAIERILANLPQTIVQITHDLDAIRDYERVIWLERGKVAGDGTPQDIIPAYIKHMTEQDDAFADLS